MEKELLDVSSKWIKDEVVEIVKKHQRAESFCQESWVIVFNVTGEHEGTFSFVINKDDNSQDEIQVIPGEYKNADITIE